VCKLVSFDCNWPDRFGHTSLLPSSVSSDLFSRQFSRMTVHYTLNEITEWSPHPCKLLKHKGFLAKEQNDEKTARFNDLHIYDYTSVSCWFYWSFWSTVYTSVSHWNDWSLLLVCKSLILLEFASIVPTVVSLWFRWGFTVRRLELRWAIFSCWDVDLTYNIAELTRFTPMRCIFIQWGVVKSPLRRFAGP